MILNPVIQGGGAEKVYKITNQNANYIFSGARHCRRNSNIKKRKKHIDISWGAHIRWRIYPVFNIGGHYYSAAKQSGFTRQCLFHHACTGCDNHPLTTRKAVAV